MPPLTLLQHTSHITPSSSVHLRIHPTPLSPTLALPAVGPTPPSLTYSPLNHFPSTHHPRATAAPRIRKAPAGLPRMDRQRRHDPSDLPRAHRLTQARAPGERAGVAYQRGVRQPGFYPRASLVRPPFPPFPCVTEFLWVFREQPPDAEEGRVLRAAECG